MDVIWCVKTEQEVRFSYNWLKEILCFENEYFDQDRKFNIIKDNVYIMWCEQNYNKEFIDYLESYNRMDLNYVVVHLSDEAYEQNIDFYKYARKIMRNYHNKEYSLKYNIMTFPLGYQTGVKYHEIHRNYFFNFIGQMKSDRQDMIKNFFNNKSNFLCLTKMWADPNGLNVEEYSRKISESYFTLCPRGWINLDSFRICESLECKSIPIVIYDKDGTDYFKDVFGNHPFIIENNWQSCRDTVNKMSDKDIMIKLFEINTFWIEFKNKLKEKVKRFSEL